MSSIDIARALIAGFTGDLLKGQAKLSVTCNLDQDALKIGNQLSDMADDHTAVKINIQTVGPLVSQNQLPLNGLDDAAGTETPRPIILCRLAESITLPPLAAQGYEYVVAGNGFWIRAEDSRLEALIPVAPAVNHGLYALEPVTTLKLDRIPELFLWSVLESGRRHLPAEALYQFEHKEDHWNCTMPEQVADPASVDFQDPGQAVVDLHSHNSMGAFFSSADDQDEGGLRFYAVIGKIDTETPEIAIRCGVYGHHWPVPVTTVFEGPGPFIDLYGLSDEKGLVVIGDPIPGEEMTEVKEIIADAEEVHADTHAVELAVAD